MTGETARVGPKTNLEKFDDRFGRWVGVLFLIKTEIHLIQNIPHECSGHGIAAYPAECMLE